MAEGRNVSRIHRLRPAKNLAEMLKPEGSWSPDAFSSWSPQLGAVQVQTACPDGQTAGRSGLKSEDFFGQGRCGVGREEAMPGLLGESLGVSALRAVAAEGRGWGSAFPLSSATQGKRIPWEWPAPAPGGALQLPSRVPGPLPQALSRCSQHRLRRMRAPSASFLLRDSVGSLGRAPRGNRTPPTHVLDSLACAPSVCLANCSAVTRASSGRRPLSSHTSLSLAELTAHRRSFPALIVSSSAGRRGWNDWE